MQDEYLDIDTPGLSALLLMLCPQSTEHLVALCTTERILCKSSRNDLQCGCIPLHSMLGETFQPTSIRVHSFAELEFRGTCAGNESRVLEQGLDHVDAIVDRPFQVVQMVGRRPSQNDRRRARLFRPGIVPCLILSQLSEYRDTVSADFRRLEYVDVAGFFWGRSTDSGEGGGVDDAAYSAKVEF